jgi:1,4-dihydroxy-2-naphthoate octaprenyltransferase
MMACALLEANNLRDVSGDQLAKKRTLAARMGRKRGAWLYVACILGVVVGFSGAGLWPVSILALVLYWPELRLAFSLKEGRELLVMLKYSARAQLVLGGVTAVWFLSR